VTVTGSPTEGVKTVLHPVFDLAAAKTTRMATHSGCFRTAKA
jgi:hypothetical protein